MAKYFGLDFKAGYCENHLYRRDVNNFSRQQLLALFSDKSCDKITWTLYILATIGNNIDQVYSSAVVHRAYYLLEKIVT